MTAKCDMSAATKEAAIAEGGWRSFIWSEAAQNIHLQ